MLESCFMFTLWEINLTRVKKLPNLDIMQHVLPRLHIMHSARTLCTHREVKCLMLKLGIGLHFT